MSPIKVTDKRIFTPEGEVKSEYKELLRGSGIKKEVSKEEKKSDSKAREVTAKERAQDKKIASPSVSFLDLVNHLAHNALVFMGDIPAPDGSITKDPELARLFVDFLEVLKEKAYSNLNFEERNTLDDVLYKLKLRYTLKMK